jgi:penicillin-binding protein 2
MVTNQDNKTTLGIDRTKLRLAILAVLIVAAFVALFSRLWFLQVLAFEDYQVLAEENKVRFVHSEPPRGRILDRNGNVLVDNRKSLAVTVDREVVSDIEERRRVFGRLSRLLDMRRKDLREHLDDKRISPYKPVPVAFDVNEDEASYIWEHQEKFPGVNIVKLPVRRYPSGEVLAQTLGYVGEIREEQLDSKHFEGADPPYRQGDIVGQMGVEYTYDRQLRGESEIEKVVVNSRGEVVDSLVVQEERPGRDLYLSIDLGLQEATEKALEEGIFAARRLYQAPAGGAVVMDPRNGQVLATASFPTYEPSMLADGISDEDWRELGGATPDDPSDDKLLNRVIQSQHPPGSTFKTITAGAAMAHGVADAYTSLDCPPSRVYPPQGGPGSVTFRNHTSSHLGSMGFARSLETSCNTFYYELGWRLETSYGVIWGDKTERYQRYMRRTGFGRTTGIDLPHEKAGRVPDQEWCDSVREMGLCQFGWLPGYTVNMTIGQGDLTVTPIQMAVSHAAIANGGRVMRPRVGMAIGRTTAEGEERILREFKPNAMRRLPLDDTQIGVIRQGLVDVVSGSRGTARGAFAGFPTDRYPIAGKTGTGQISGTDQNFAWFVSYGPVPEAEYVIAVYLERAGGGSESAAPVARAIWEYIFGIDRDPDVELSTRVGD